MMLAALALASAIVVVDGDTIRLGDERIRIETIDAPELHGQCREERRLAERARERLAELLAAAPVDIERHKLDRYGRTLAIVTAGGQEVGAILVAEGLARLWDGRRHPWC